MTASISFYNSFRKTLADGTVDLDGHVFKLMLVSSSYTFDAQAHTVKADITNELSTANGYTAGGYTLLSVTWTQSTVTMTFDSADPVWTASGGSIVARRAVLYDDTPTSPADPLVLSVLLDTTPADVTTTTGNTLTIVVNASGWFTIT